ncbi:Fanconi anemia group J protein-like, partial [Armadillidium vulgare]
MVGTVSKGPTNHVLNATYKHSETLAFQDELGRMLLSVCETIPRGVLCFLPSYAMLDKLVDRWQRSSIWEEIEKVKVPITEPRNSEDFENSMKLFYSTIERTKDCKEGEVNGALFIAVCRGKVSEGMDFIDDNARAVIAVGIPFPNTKDIQVNLKREYNDKFSKSKGLLTGGEWYEIQAYRALNQALGRCIRHRYDWGAIILVDERYQRAGYGNNLNRYVKGLSKWVRNSLKHEPSFDVIVSELKKFSNFMQESSLNWTEKEEVKEKQVAADTPKPKF